MFFKVGDFKLGSKQNLHISFICCIFRFFLDLSSSQPHIIMLFICWRDEIIYPVEFPSFGWLHFGGGYYLAYSFLLHIVYKLEVRSRDWVWFGSGFNIWGWKYFSTGAAVYFLLHHSRQRRMPSCLNFTTVMYWTWSAWSSYCQC